MAVSACLCQDSLAHIHKNECKIGGGGAHNHVARVLLVTGRIDCDESASVGFEVTPRHINGNSLFALRLQPIHQQGQIYIVPLGAMDPACCSGFLELIFRNRPGITKQPAKEGRLAVIHGSANDEPQ